MNFYQDATITALSVHRVGNQTEGEVLLLSEAGLPVKDEKIQDLLKRYFGNPFSTPEFFVFKEPVTNPVCKAASAIFTNPAKLHEQSRAIAKHHYETALHVSIPAGDLVVAHMTDVKVDGEVMDAVAIFKVENREEFLQLNEADDAYLLGFDVGLNVNKPDKGCLIFNTGRDEGYKVCFVEKGRGFGATPYWKDEFLQLQPAADNFHSTKNFMDLTKAFVSDRLSEEYEVDKTDQAHFLNKTMHYFKENDKLDTQAFGTAVFEDPSVVESFRNYKDHYQSEYAVQIPEDFAISNQAVKKQARIFKSVLKLDKNFHIYIHGNRNMIERGVDDAGRKYYRIYYNQEF